VFHHQSAPFPDVVRLAKGQLDQAKRATRGEEPSVAFLDLTADGGHGPAGRQPLTLTDLNEMAGRLGQIARIPRAHLQTLVALHRRCAEHPEAGTPDTRAETPPEALARRVVDLGQQPLWDASAGPKASAEDVRSKLTSTETARNELRRVLDLARWWPAAGVSPAPTSPAAGRSVREEVPA
jgi:hypothetical protein